ncbi:prolactin-releasing peptide receptor-like [Glandiceps talaboti]
MNDSIFATVGEGVEISIEDYKKCICDPYLCPPYLQEMLLNKFNDLDPVDMVNSVVEYTDSSAESSLPFGPCDIDGPGVWLNEMTYVAKVVLSVVYGLTMLLTLSGNILVICVLSSPIHIKSEMNKLLINLSVADICMVFFCMPFTFAYVVMRYWIFGSIICPLVFFMQQVSVAVSICTLTAIGIDRYFAVSKPIARKTAGSRSKYIVTATWVTALCFSIPELVVVRTYIDGGTTQCSERWPSANATLIYEVFMVSASYVFPLCVLFVTYRKIGKFLWKQEVPGNNTLHSVNERRAQKVKTVRLLVIVVSAFLLCWLPLNVFNIVMAVKPKILDDASSQSIAMIVFIFCQWVAMANSFLNPIIYTFIKQGFRNDVRRLFKIHRRSSSFSVPLKRKRTSSNSSGLNSSQKSRITTLSAVKVTV